MGEAEHSEDSCAGAGPREAQLAHELDNSKALQDISTRLIENGDGHGLHEEILDAALKIMRADCASIQMLDMEKKELILLAWRGFHPDSARFWQRVSIKTGTSCGSALRHGQRIVIANVNEDEGPRGTPSLQHYRLSGIASVQSTPLTSREGHLLGMISTHWRTPHRPDEQDLRAFDILAREAADFFERSRVTEALRESEERFRQFANASSDGLWIRDAESLTMEYVSPAIASIYGIAREAIMGDVRRWAGMIVPEDP